jgi:site-specific DNA-methyltransferase (adenine-specific)
MAKKLDSSLQNKLFYGDNLDVLRNTKYVPDESVDLVYIDPPFNSKRNYNQIYTNVGKEDKAQAQAFVDTWTWDDEANKGLQEILTNARGFTAQTISLIAGLEKVLQKGSLFAYIVSMTLRIHELHRALKKTGSFYLHCDPTASHYLKLVLDAIFCSQGGDFKNEIVWERTNAHNMKSKYFGRTHDVIFFYTKDAKDYTWNEQFTDYGEAQLSRFKKDETGRLYKAENLTFSSANKTRQFEWRGTKPPANRSWGASLEQLEDWWDEGRILTKQDGTPRMDGLKFYLDDLKGKSLNDMWYDIDRIGNTSSESLGYPTQKPEQLLERIITASTNKGDTILDSYCGCGTTISVAQMLGRRWIGVDITYQSISLILKRLVDSYGDAILETVNLNGVPQDIESAIALANKTDDRTRKEFEKWCVLTYSRNRAIINEKKGADGGIDGTAFINDFEANGADVGLKTILFSVKSDKHPKVSYIRDLNGAMQRDGAVMGYFITLYPPTSDMVKEVKQLGKYNNTYFGKDYDRIKIITVEQLLKGEIFDVPISHEIKVVKSAKKKTTKGQKSIFEEDPS